MQQNAVRSNWGDDNGYGIGMEAITVHTDDSAVDTGLVDVNGRKLMRSAKGPCGFVGKTRCA